MAPLNHEPLPSGATYMLAFDITGLSLERLHALLANSCARFGQVCDVLLCAYNVRDRCAVAEVEMATQEEADTLAAGIGDSQQGTWVTINVVVQAEDEHLLNSEALWRRAGGRLDLDQRIKAARLTI
jgi:hypothetical protein